MAASLAAPHDGHASVALDDAREAPARPPGLARHRGHVLAHRTRRAALVALGVVHG